VPKFFGSCFFGKAKVNILINPSIRDAKVWEKIQGVIDID
jgi:hypothetical protein